MSRSAPALWTAHGRGLFPAFGPDEYLRVWASNPTVAAEIGAIDLLSGRFGAANFDLRRAAGGELDLPTARPLTLSAPQPASGVFGSYESVPRRPQPSDDRRWTGMSDRRHRHVGYMRLKTPKGLAVLNLLTPVNDGAGEKSRTPDLRITNARKIVFARIHPR
jgi:hypothetical protein